MIHCLMLINRQGKVRLIKWYDTFLLSERQKQIREVFIKTHPYKDSCNGNRKIKQTIKFY
jgi:hypothetical protein